MTPKTKNVILSLIIKVKIIKALIKVKLLPSDLSVTS